MSTFKITTLYLLGRDQEPHVRELTVNYSSLRELTDFASIAYAAAASITVEQVS